MNQTQKVLIKDLSRANQAFGNKASNLAFLMKKGFRVPQGFALKWSGPLPLDASSIRQIKTLIQPLIDEHERYVVRSSAEDVFYLDYGKIKDSLLPKAASCEQFRDQVQRVKEEMASLEDIEVPDMIIGETPPPVVKRGVQRNEIQGLGVSGGYVKGRLVHVNTLHQMGKIRPGDIVAIPYSDISWTPVFSKATGIISESGGMLSHSAIVAREFAIPAIVSAKNIFSIPEQTEIIMDGYSGKIEMMVAQQPESEG